MMLQSCDLPTCMIIQLKWRPSMRARAGFNYYEPFVTGVVARRPSKASSMGPTFYLSQYRIRKQNFWGQVCDNGMHLCITNPSV